MRITDENDQAVRCAVDQVPIDMPSVEVRDARLYREVNYAAPPGFNVVLWYVEVDIWNLNDDATARVLYGVWRSSGVGAMRAVHLGVKRLVG